MSLQTDKILARMSRRQRAAYARYLKHSQCDALQYLVSFVGLPAPSLNPERLNAPDKDSNDKYTVRNQPGQIVAEYHARNRKAFDPKEFHKPTTNGAWYGVEIECYLPKAHFDQSDPDCDGSCRDNCDCYEYSCSECGNEHDEPQGECSCECDDSCGGLETYSIDSLRKAIAARKIKHVQVVEDGSLSDDADYFGVEIKVLVDLNKPENLKQICAFLTGHDAKINKSCGLHVHINATDLNKPAALNKLNASLLKDRLASAMDVLQFMVSPSRRDNRYCLPGASDIDSGDRYRWINGSAYTKHGTIEVRIHNGTTSFMKIHNWLRILDAIRCHDGSVMGHTIEMLMTSLGLDNDLKAYIRSRIAQFSPEKAVETMESEALIFDIDQMAQTA